MNNQFEDAMKKVISEGMASDTEIADFMLQMMLPEKSDAAVQDAARWQQVMMGVFSHVMMMGTLLNIEAIQDRRYIVSLSIRVYQHALLDAQATPHVETSERPQ